MRLRDVSRRCERSLFFFFLFFFRFVSFCFLLKEEIQSAVRMEDRLYKMYLHTPFYAFDIDQISKLPPKQSKMIMMFTVSALRAIFALCERIAYALTEPERSKNIH